MILKDNLYKLQSLSTEHKNAEIGLLRDCFIYKAHFPELPVTPGVCIIQTAGELLEELIGKKVSLSSIANAKFLAVINPDENSCVTYNFKKIEESEDNAIVKASITVTNNNITFAKLSLVYNTI